MLYGNYSQVCRDGTFGPGVPQIAECRGGFDFTVTFEESIFSIGPACLLLALLPWRFLSLWRRTCKTKRSWLHELKLIGFAALGALQAILLAFFSKSHTEYRTVLVSSATLQLCATILLGLLSYWEHRNALRPSFLISTFLVLTLILDAARARTQALIEGQKVVASILIAIVAVKALLLIIETKGKTRILFPEYSELSSEIRSSIFSRAFFLWLNPLLLLGFKGVISSQDLPPIYETLSSEILTAKVESRWKRGSSKGKHALMVDLLLSFPKELVIIIISSTIQVGLQICQPLLVREIVTFLESPTAPINIGYGIIGGFFCVSFGLALVIPWYFHYQFRVMIMARGALVSMIYSKLLQSRVNGFEQSTAFTLMTTDVEKIVDVFWRLLEPWSSILQISICTYLLYQQLGAICCVPIIAILLTFGLVALAGYKVPYHQNTWFQAIEARVNLTTHTLDSLQSVKLLGLSGRMEANIQKKREGELQISQKFRVSNCLALTASFCPTFLSPLITFGAYSIMRMVSHESPFSVTTAVTSLSILTLITTPAKQLLLAIPLGLQAVGSFDRIQSFLQLVEIPVSTVASISNDTEESLTQEKRGGAGPTISAQHPLHEPMISAKRVADGDDMIGHRPIAGQTICFTPNSLTAITGPIGCGKSTVLKSFLSEETQELCPFPSKDIAYCGQTPWIHDGTVRDNIIGQSKLDNLWYKEVVCSCELDIDISRMPEGDATEVGSRGLRLSGGQRQRISIARALYANKKRVVFDDVTSALDGRTLCAVAQKVFGKNGILRSKGTSVVLATHAVQILQLVDRILLMGKEGEIIDSGTYEQIAQRHRTIVQCQTPVSTSESEIETLVEDEANLGEYQTQLHTRIDDLRRQKGDWRSYTFYIGSMGWLKFSIFLLGAALYVVLNSIFLVWLTWWAEDTTGGHGLGYWLGLYATWALLMTLALLVTPIFFFTNLAFKASERLHKALLAAVMRAPMSIISNTEIGSLVNRFSQDIRLCDWQLPFNIILTLFAFMACLASVGFAIAAVPYIAIGMPVLGVVLYFLQLFYLRTSRQLRLLEIELKAPIVSLFLDTSQGLTTIRAFGWSQAYIRKSFYLLDSSQKPYYLLFCVQRWLLLVLALIVAALQILVVGLAIALRTSVSASLVGLAIIQVSTLTEAMSDFVMQWTEMETSLGAVTRISRFTHETPRESHLDERAAIDEWPSDGSITFENVSAAYDPNTQGSLVLNNITFSVNPGEHIGVCGRTGSGKSSLVAALLRLLPCHQGHILIDDIDIATLNPDVLRSKLNIVTQEPFLFEGTIRENLNPWSGEVSDNEMIQALEQVDLWNKITSLGGLDAPLEDISLSHGQRQLFCLARALLRKSNILVLDEPTGHIDPVTDATIQRVIRSGFRDRTIIMIAHRLQSLVNFDRVIVLDTGRLIEIGPPNDLLNDESSSFSGLYRASEGGKLDRGS